MGSRSSSIERRAPPSGEIAVRLGRPLGAGSGRAGAAEGRRPAGGVGGRSAEASTAWAPSSRRPHILQKFIPPGFLTPQAGQATEREGVAVLGTSIDATSAEGLDAADSTLWMRVFGRCE